VSGRHERSLPPGYFDDLYDRAPDPWSFETSPYEQAKYQATVSALGGRSYRHGLEVGCSIGVLTSRLAGSVRDLLAVDVSDKALASARERCRLLPHVRFRNMQVPACWPAERFDLIVLSEVLYYLDRADLGELVERVRSSLLPGGDSLLVHWTGPTDYPLSGDEAAASFIAGAASFMRVRRQDRTADYRLDLLRRIR
jgi:cyclopropane fatty-acyl-phospholipid synthase-like methyltransferase